MNAPRANPPKDSTPTMKPLAEPEQGKQGSEGDDDPIQPGHLPCSTVPCDRSPRHQRLRRAAPVLALAAIAFLVGAIVGADHGASAGQSVSERFVTAWTQRRLRDHVRRYRPGRAARISASRFRDAYLQACARRRRPAEGGGPGPRASRRVRR